jgi:hypothetical protein
VVQEEADVESRVEDFVAGATEEPTLPTPEPSTDSPTAETPGVTVASTSSPVTVEVKATDPAIAADDDKLMTDAAAALVNSTEDKVGDTPAEQPVEPAAETTPVPDTASSDKGSSKNDSRTKRIIKPLDSGPKKDLDTLLAIEEAKAAKSKATTAPAAVVAADDPKAPLGSVPPNPVIEPPAGAPPATTPGSVLAAPATQPNNPADPDSIAL